MNQNIKTAAKHFRVALRNFLTRFVLVGMLAFGGITPTFTPECRGDYDPDGTRPTFDQEVYDRYKAEWDDVVARYAKSLNDLDKALKKAGRELVKATRKYDNLLNRKNRDDITDPWTQGDEAELQAALNAMNAAKAVYDTIRDNILSELGARTQVLSDLREAYIDEQYTEYHSYWGIH